jgi:cobaltochelatase CobS
MAMEKISALFGVPAPDAAVIETVEPSFDTPEIDDAYSFDNDQVRRLHTWWTGRVKRSLFLTGPTGCGKTTMIEQFAARVGADVFLVPCHGKLDMAELIGQMGIAKDGSTQFEYGTGVKAMKHQRPAILLLDEMNFVPPGSIGLFNRIAELKSFTISETGETIRPFPWIRIAATGNAVERGDDSARYRGTQAMNVALLNRFLGMRVNYLQDVQEAAMLNKAIPGLPGPLIERLVRMAGEIRQGFAQGALEVVMSTRTLLDVGQALRDRLSLVMKKPVEEIQWAMEFCLTDLAREEDRDAVARLTNDLFHGVKLNGVGDSAIPAAKPLQEDIASNSEVHLWIHPNRGANGAAFWGYVTLSTSEQRSFNGNLDDATTRDGEERDASWIHARIKEKQGKGYLRVDEVAKIFLPSTNKDDALQSVSELISQIRDTHKGLSTSVPVNLIDFIKAAVAHLN